MGAGPLLEAVAARCRAAKADVTVVEAVPGRLADLEALRGAVVGRSTRILVLTEDDSVNFMFAVFALQVLGARDVVVRVQDPAKERAFQELGIATVNALQVLTDAVLAALQL